MHNRAVAKYEEVQKTRDAVQQMREQAQAEIEREKQSALETLRNTPELSGIKISGILLLADFYRQLRERPPWRGR